jgi:hypothetical protein
MNFHTSEATHHMTSRTRRPIGLVALVLLSVAFMRPANGLAKPPGSDGNARFPDVKDSWSPDGRFVLKSVDHREDLNAPHSIYLTDMRLGARSVLYSYLRTVDVLWSPASDALAINDWDTNNKPRCVILRLVPRQERIDVGEELARSRQRDEGKPLARNYRDDERNRVHMIRWVDAKTILLDVEGRDSEGRRRSFRLQKHIAY